MTLDAVSRGELPRAADLLMQRFKALELSADEKSWAVASHLELSDTGNGLASIEEREAASRHALLQRKLAEARQKAAGAVGGVG